MRTLLVGSGAREHAIAWKLRQSPLVSELYVAPGNAGTARIAENVPVSATDTEKLLAFARQKGIEFTVVGPEAPLAAGIVNRFQEAGLTIFGPTREAARIESSKVFAKELMLRHGIPTARAQCFSSYEDARRYVEQAPLPVVVKADGLAAGKGVVVARTREEGLHALRQQMVEKEFGPSGDRVVIEECMQGREVSVFAFVDGERVSPLVAACDYKRIYDGDQGPNTGGMGSFSPPDVWTPEHHDLVRKAIMEPAARAMCKMGAPFQGVLYAGLMLTGEGPKVVEFNCRLGDPEAQVILPRLRSDLAEIMMTTAQGGLEGASIEWDDRACVGVVVASGGYPGKYATGFPIEGLDQVDEDVMVFHAGTKLRQVGGQTVAVTDGGRVLTVTACGPTLEEARIKAYASVQRIGFKDAYYRKDIAKQP